jgi:hypothetical protein
LQFDFLDIFELSRVAMSKPQHTFRATIYKTGINYCVDVPNTITKRLEKNKGYIRITGTVNDFPFTKSLVPVKEGPYRLFVNLATLKGATAKLGDRANFVIEQDTFKKQKEYPVPHSLKEALRKTKLTKAFNELTPARRRDILKYLSYVKTDSTMDKNINKLIKQLQQQIRNVRIP